MVSVPPVENRWPRLTVLLMKRSILEQSWAVAKPRHAGAAYNRRARTVAVNKRISVSSSSDHMEGGGRQSVSFN